MATFFTIVAVVIIGLIFVLVSIRRKPHGTDEYAQMATAHRYRTSVDQLLASRKIELDGPLDEDKLVREAVTIASWVATESLKRSGRPVATPDQDDQFVALLFAMVVSDYLSQMSKISFEHSSTLTCVTLARSLGDASGTLVAEVISSHNAMATDPQRSKLLQAIGNQVAAFFSTNSDTQLDQLGKLFEVCRRHVRTAA